VTTRPRDPTGTRFCNSSRESVLPAEQSYQGADHRSCGWPNSSRLPELGAALSEPGATKAKPPARSQLMRSAFGAFGACPLEEKTARSQLSFKGTEGATGGCFLGLTGAGAGPQKRVIQSTFRRVGHSAFETSRKQRNSRTEGAAATALQGLPRQPPYSLHRGARQ